MSSVVPPDGVHGSSHPDHATADGHSSRSDRELVELLRSGDRSATGELFRRHRDAASRVARQLVRSVADADDIVSDAFTRVFKAIDNGRGPTDNFRAYLYTAIRSSACRRHNEAKRVVLSAQYQHLVDFEASADPVVETFDRTAAGRAYGTLPERWQTVLWLVDVEDRPASEVAQILGMTPNAVAALSYRAREGLRQGFLTAHSGDRHLDTACEPVRPLLSPYVRSRTSARDTLRVERHLEHCGDCRDLIEELRNVNATILHGIAPLLVPVAAIAALRAAPSWSGAATAGGAAAGAGAAAGGAASTAAATARGVAGVATKSSAKFALPFHLPGAVVGGIGAVAAAAAITAVVLLGPATPSPEEGAGAAADPTVESTAADTPDADRPGPGVTSEVEAATATSAPESVDTTPPTTVAPGDPAAPTSSTSTTAVTATTTTPPVEPPPPVGALSVSQIGPLAPGGVGHVIVEAAGLRGADRPVRLQWTAPEGFEVRSARSDRAVCDEGGCDLAIGTTGSAGVALLIAAAPVPSSDSGTSAPLAQAAAADDAPALELVLSDPGQAYGSVAARLSLSTGKSAYSTRFAGVGRLALAATGNSVLTCTSSSACSEARAGLGTKRSNDLWAMTQIDTDTDPSTSNSSSAVLELPAGSDVVHAELVWSGQLGPASGGDPGTVRLDLGGLRTLTADAVVFGADGSYQASVDVTALLSDAAGAATAVPVTVGGIAVDPRPGSWAGWGLAVVVEQADLPRRATVLALGLDAGGGSLSLLPGGVGRVDEVLAVIWDGDPDLGPDGIDIEGGETPPASLVDPANPLGDLGNSSVSIRGVRPVGPDPNTFGVDVDLIRADDTERREPTLRTVAGPERLFVGLLGASIDLG